jgi:hypothetical protein
MSYYLNQPYNDFYGWRTGNVEELTDKEMQDQGWTRYRDPSELPAGATTHRVDKEQDITYTAGDNEQFGTRTWTGNYYKAAPPPAAAPAPAPAPAPAAAPAATYTAPAATPVSASSPQAGPQAVEGAYQFDTVKTEGDLDKYLAKETDYDDWLSKLVKPKEEDKDDDDGGSATTETAKGPAWRRYFDESVTSGPLQTWAKDGQQKRTTRMAGSGDFTSGLNGIISNYSSKGFA